MMRLCWIIKQRQFIIRHSRNNKKALRAFLLDCPGRFLCEVVDGKDKVKNGQRHRGTPDYITGNQHGCERRNGQQDREHNHSWLQRGSFVHPNRRTETPD